MSLMELDELNRRVRDLEDRVGKLEAAQLRMAGHLAARLKEEADAARA